MGRFYVNVLVFSYKATKSASPASFPIPANEIEINVRYHFHGVLEKHPTNRNSFQTVQPSAAQLHTLVVAGNKKTTRNREVRSTNEKMNK